MNVTATVNTNNWVEVTKDMKLTAHVGGYSTCELGYSPHPAIVQNHIEQSAEEPGITRDQFFGVLGKTVGEPEEVSEELEARVDERLEADVEAGKFDELARRALEAHRKGEVTAL